MAIKLRKKSKKETWAKGREKFLEKKARESEKFSKKQDRVQTRLERQEDRVAKTMAKRDIRRLKKGKDVKGTWVESENPERPGRNFFPDSTDKRVRDAGPLAFKKKKLIKLRDKAGKMARAEAFKGQKHGFRGGMMADRGEGDVRMDSSDRLSAKKKAYRTKKGY